MYQIHPMKLSIGFYISSHFIILLKKIINTKFFATIINIESYKSCQLICELFITPGPNFIILESGLDLIQYIFHAKLYIFQTIFIRNV